LPLGAEREREIEREGLSCSCVGWDGTESRGDALLVLQLEERYRGRKGKVLTRERDGRETEKI